MRIRTSREILPRNGDTKTAISSAVPAAPVSAPHRNTLGRGAHLPPACHSPLPAGLPDSSPIGRREGWKAAEEIPFVMLDARSVGNDRGVGGIG